MPAPFVKSRVLHYDLLREIELDQDIEVELREACGDQDPEFLESLYDGAVGSFAVGQIITGKIINITKDSILVDIGYKSEGSINANEFDEPGELDIGDSINVLLEQVEDDSGMVVLSKRKADRIRGWELIISEKGEGDKVKGKALRKIKGGLLVDIGVPVFLPASQVSIRSIGDIGQLIGQEIEAKIIKIDMERRNIVISRRKLIEEEREVMKSTIMSKLEVGQARTGQVKNITDFGAFVDLGGIDGLLHITDMSWGRISHPSEIVALDQKIEVLILDIDREREKISLGLKQKSASPWAAADGKYTVGSKHIGEVVNLMSYGAFVKLEDGIEGLVHISEMSWTRRINHPSEAVTIGDEVEVAVLGINMEKQEISLGMKQTDDNPWDKIDDRYPPNTRVSGRVRNLANYGAFIELEEGIDGLLHVSDISWTKKVTHPSEVLKKGQMIDAIILKVEKDRKRIALGLKQLEENPWDSYIPDNYSVGQIVSGRVTKITNFGVFVQLEAGLEGLLHISELSDGKIVNPEDIVKIGDELDVKVIKLDVDGSKIGLSLRQVSGGQPRQVTPSVFLEDVDQGEEPVESNTPSASDLMTEDEE